MVIANTRPIRVSNNQNRHKRMFCSRACWTENHWICQWNWWSKYGHPKSNSRYIEKTFLRKSPTWVLNLLPTKMWLIYVCAYPTLTIVSVVSWNMTTKPVAGFKSNAVYRFRLPNGQQQRFSTRNFDTYQHNEDKCVGWKQVIYE